MDPFWGVGVGEDPNYNEVLLSKIARILRNVPTAMANYEELTPNWNYDQTLKPKPLLGTCPNNLRSCLAPRPEDRVAKQALAAATAAATKSTAGKDAGIVRGVYFKDLVGILDLGFRDMQLRIQGSEYRIFGLWL